MVILHLTATKVGKGNGPEIIDFRPVL